MPGKRITRRDFVRDSAVASLSFTIVPRHVLGQGSDEYIRASYRSGWAL